MRTTRFAVSVCTTVVMAVGGVVALFSPVTLAASSVYISGVNASSFPVVGQFDVGPGGALTAKSPLTVPAEGTPRSLAISPDGRSVYVPTESGEAVYQYDVGPGGLLSPKSPASVPAGKLPSAIAVSPDGKSVYVTDRNDTVLSQYDVGPGGALSPKSPATVKTGLGAFGVAASPDGRSVYVTSASDGAVFQYDVGPGGILSPKSPATVPDAESPWGIAVSPDGTSVYVADGGHETVAQFSVGAGGALSPKSPATVKSGKNAEPRVAVSPDGKSVYVNSSPGNTISQYDVGAGGGLTPKSPATVTAAGASAIALSPDGRSAYVTDSGGTNQLQFDVSPSGVLSPKSSPTVESIYGLDVAVSPDQGPVAAFSDVVLLGGSATGGAAVFDGSSSSDVDGGVVRYDWSFGDGATATNAGAFPSHFYGSFGTYIVTLTVTDDAGCSTAEIFTGQTAYCSGSLLARVSHAVTVAPTATVAPVISPTKPTLSALTESHSAFAVGSLSTPLTGVTAASHPKGTIFSFRLDQQATVKVAVETRTAGRRLGRSCKPATPGLRHKKRCTRTITLGTLTRSAHAGLNTLAFSGRLARRALKPGRYRAVFIASAAAGKSAARTLRFTIVKR